MESRAHWGLEAVKSSLVLKPTGRGAHCNPHPASQLPGSGAGRPERKEQTGNRRVETTRFGDPAPLGPVLLRHPAPHLAAPPASGEITLMP